MPVQNSRRLSELLEKGGTRLSQLKARSAQRAAVLDHLRAALPPRLAHEVLSAGLESGKLSIGVASAAWASRLRYHTEHIRKRVGKSSGQEITAVRIRVVPPAGRPLGA